MAFRNTKDTEVSKRDQDGARLSDLHLELNGPQDAMQAWSEKRRADSLVFGRRPPVCVCRVSPWDSGVKTSLRCWYQ